MYRYDVNWEEERDSVTDHHTLYLPAALVPGGALDTTIEMDCTALAWCVSASATPTDV